MRVLTENIRNLRGVIADLRHEDIPATKELIAQLESSNDTEPEQLELARLDLEDFQLELHETIESKIEERLYVQCLRECIGNLFSGAVNETFAVCIDNC